MIKLEQIQLDSIISSINSRSKLSSPIFTGIPQVPTAAIGTNTNQVASTAFVLANAGSGTVDPNRPSALVIMTPNMVTTGTIIFDNVIKQIGSNYNSLNGRFTCPTTGWYFVSFSTLLWNMGSSSSVQLLKNGAIYGPSAWTYGTFTGTYAIQGASHMCYANAGDYFEFYHNRNTTNLHGSYTCASFALQP